MLNIFKFLKKIVGLDRGKFAVTRGEHALLVPIDICAKHVWIHIEERHRHGCGQQCEMTQVGYVIHHKKIYFTINCKSERCVVKWAASA